MKCPHCATENLLMTERQGIEIDYCPVCRGVWLDRGELDKLLSRRDHQADTSHAPRSLVSDNSLPHQDHREERQSNDRSKNHRHPYGDDHDERYDSRYGRKKESFWERLFDFD
jgi:uncharacterized protein